MIKKVNYQNGDSAIVAEFGQGDLLVGPAKNSIGSAFFIQNNQQREEIGTLHPEHKGKSIDTIPGNKIILTFTSVDSIDIVIASLMEAKEHLVKNPIEEF